MYRAVQLLDKSGNKCFASPYWPIGSIYLSFNDTNPATFFGGTWERLTGGFLYGCVNNSGTGNGTGTSTGASSGNTGSYSGTSGSYSGKTGSTAISIDQMPSHSHNFWYNTTNSGYATGSSLGTCKTASDTIQNNGTYDFFIYTQNRGGGKGHTHSIPSHTHSIPSHTHSLNSHTHVVPYIAVFAWRRIA